MTENSFFKKVINYLAELNKGTQDRLEVSGWLKPDEVRRINVILEKLALIEHTNNETKITRKGLNILLFFKIGKINDQYNDETLQLLLNNTNG